MKRKLTAEELIKIVKAACAISSQKQVAENIGTSPEHLNRVLKGQYEISDEFARKLGYKRHVTFEEEQDAR